MARTKIRLADEIDLPSVCCCCAKPASVEKATKFVWHPPWVFAVAVLVGVLPLVLLLPLTRRSATFPLPFCDAHSRRGRRGAKVLLAGLALAAAVAAAGYYLVLPADASLGWNVLIGSAGVAAVTGLVAAFIAGTRVRAKEIGDWSVTLDGVSAAFALAISERSGPRLVVPDGGMELATAKFFRR
jgi:predicted lysophospholipase L1 biosynthesis ABC-type transport system permease subunit